MTKDGGFLLPETIDPPTRCVSLDIPDDPNHIRAFWGALNELAYWFNWQRDTEKTGLAASLVWARTLQAGYARFISDNPCGNEMGEDCVEMAPHHPAIEWQPTNPFLDPYEQPSGYLLPPFSIVNLSLPGIDLAYLAGLKNGDVIATLLSIPGNPLEILVDGLPRFLIRVNGIGTVTIHLINLPLGGIAAIGKDTYIDIPGLIIGVIGAGVTLVDLNRDLVSVPPETSTIIGQQIEFTEPGPHFIEVAFIPILDDAVTPVRYGGGLRGLTVCGFEPLNGNNVIRQNPEDCNILEQSADGINWTTVADYTDCFASMDCDDVVDCVTDSEEFIEDMLDLIREHPGGDIYPKDEPIPDNTRITITQPGECDYDVLWSQCVGVVSTAHVMIGQFFSAWSAYATEGNVVAAIVGNVPLLAPVAYSLGLAGVQGYAALIISSIAALYSAAADDTYREQLACELFCVAQTNCYVTIDDATQVLNSRVGGLISLISTTDIMTSLINLDLTGLNVADVYMAAFFDLLHQGNHVWPITWGMESFLMSVAAYNVPSNAWETACDPCTPPDDCFQFAIDEQGLTTPSTGDAQYNSGTGWGQTNNTYLTIDSPQDGTVIHTVRIKFARAFTGVNDLDKFFIHLYNWGGSGNSQVFPAGGALATGDEITVTTTGADWVDLRVQVVCGGLTFAPANGFPAQYITEVCYDPV